MTKDLVKAAFYRSLPVLGGYLVLGVGFGILLGRYLGFGVLGIWMAMFADWLLRIFFFLPRFHGHKWETMGIRE